MSHQPTSHIATSRPSTPDTIYDVLRRSPVARVLAGMELGEGCAVTVWENTRDRVCYQAPAHTTFSLYLEGGTGTRRLDAGGVAGYPGAICVMPEGCGSDWEINAPFRFVHLYLSEARLRSGFVSTHDCDARSLDLPEATFVRNPDLAIPLAQLAAAGAEGDVLHAETTLAELFGALRRKPVTIRAGLAPHILRRVDDWIDAHLDQTITLDDLAALADLSGFHFHRMFHLSRGLAPHAWVTWKRVARARMLLRTDQPIAAIAAACGFSSQSHLTRVFQRHVGKTPAVYRGAVIGSIQRHGAFR
ncbi:helix-turn-helix transcriptional regulator [Tistrella mobilis]|uniref:Transcriptional regulator protein, AraC family n=1 Tax=Tistrella mobilis (strain KA081020-065) TaxID=1110502 RepID=I3TUV7_TISMK|nr:AraC family transcriptional regulator [Tistrella mobilis]AFK56545.1 putative transcriptional regulator protein, AraC family [Tistrella mobilis KA081020-065]